MSIVTIGGGAVNLTGATSITVKPSLWSYVPKLLVVPVIAFAIYFAAECAAVILGLLLPSGGSVVSTWEKVYGTAGFLFLISLAVAVAISGARVILYGSDHDAALSTITATLWLGLGGCFIGAIFSYKFVNDMQLPAGSSMDAAMRLQFIRDSSQAAMLYAGSVVILLFSILSLRLLDLKDVIIAGDGEPRRVSNVTSYEAARLVGGLPQ